MPNTVLGFVPMFSSAAATLTGPPQLSEAVLNGDLQMPADFLLEPFCAKPMHAAARDDDS